MRDRKLMGNLGEEFATGILFAQGYEILERNFRCRLGEIDIVCQKDGKLCFVEVKTRASLDVGYPADAVGREKQRRMKHVAEYYLMTHGGNDVDVSFQVVEILVNQINNAF